MRFSHTAIFSEVATRYFEFSGTFVHVYVRISCPIVSHSASWKHWEERLVVVSARTLEPFGSVSGRFLSAVHV